MGILDGCTLGDVDELSSQTMTRDLLTDLEPFALAAVRAAALRAAEWVGRGDGKAADGAATEAMRQALDDVVGCGIVVIGEGEKDNAPMLHNGERLGRGTEPAFDIAVDPLECTDLCADGLPGSLTTIAMAAGGGLWSPGPVHYMDKLVVGAVARDAVDLRDEPEITVEKLAAALGRRPRDITVMVLDKPRHVELIARLRATGARVCTPSGGDVAGALYAAMPDGGIDALMGIGGTPEGVMAACAVRALGGGMQVRLAPQREAEALALEQTPGLSTHDILGLDDLVTGPALFAATGVTGGGLLRAPWRTPAGIHTESLLIRPGALRKVVHTTPAPADDA